MCIFIFEQKPAYEFLSGLVGSAMCIRDRGFSAAEDPQSLIGEPITISGEIYGEDTIHDRRPVVMINAVIQKNK